jgi:sugar phosphate isomerase/epimerase
MFHQHAPEMANNAREWRHLLANTDPEVKVCLDVHWIYRGGQDVMTILKEAAPRLAALHLRNSKDGIWLEELADGDVDYRQVAAYLKDYGFNGYLVVELAWDPKTRITAPLESNIRRSLNYAEDIFKKQ